MVDGLTPRLDPGKAAGKTIRIPLTLTRRGSGTRSGSGAAKPSNGPSFGKQSYGNSNVRTAPSKQPGATSKLGAKAPQSIGGLEDPGDDASVQGRDVPQEASPKTNEQMQNLDSAQPPSGGTEMPKTPLPQPIPSSVGAENEGNTSQAGSQEGGEENASSENQANGEPSEQGEEAGSTPADDLAKANNLQREKDADEEKKGGVPDVAGLDEISENPVELMQAAQSGDSKKIRDKALEYLKKAVIKEFIMPLVIGALPTIIIGTFIFAGIIIVVVVAAAIVGNIPGIGILTKLSSFLHPPTQ